MTEDFVLKSAVPGKKFDLKLKNRLFNIISPTRSIYTFRTSINLFNSKKSPL